MGYGLSGRSAPIGEDVFRGKSLVTRSLHLNFMPLGQEPEIVQIRGHDSRTLYSRPRIIQRRAIRRKDVFRRLRRPCERNKFLQCFGEALFGDARTERVIRTVTPVDPIFWGRERGGRATKRGDGMEGNSYRLYRQSISRWGVASGGGIPEVKKLPLKGTGEARCKPPRGRAWLRDRMVSSNEVGFNLRETSPPAT